jgi:hypothetical protein
MQQAQPVPAQPGYRDIVSQPAPEPNRYQAALDAQLAKAKAIGMQRNQQAQQMMAAQTAAKPVAQAQPQQADPQALISNGLRTGVLSYGDLDQIGLNRDQFDQFREGVAGIKQQYGMKS